MARPVSPYSARKLLTQKLADGTADAPRNASRGRDGAPRHAPERASQAPWARCRSRSRSRSQESTSKDSSRRRERDRGAAERSPGADHRDPSPAPYRKQERGVSEGRRGGFMVREKDGASERRRDGPGERGRDGCRERKRERSGERRRDRSQERKRERSGEKRRDRSRDGARLRSRDANPDRAGEPERSNGFRRKKDCSRSRDRHYRSKKQDDRRSRSPIPYRSRKPRHHSRSPSMSKSPSRKRRRRTRSPSQSRSPSPHQRSTKSLAPQETSFRGLDDSAQPPSQFGGAPRNKEKPNFHTTGLLAQHANRVQGTTISLKYHEPGEARKPPSSQRWRVFVFKGEDIIDTMELWQKSCWLLGRAHQVVDYVLEHPSSSGQHAVIQFRHVVPTVEAELGVTSQRGKVKPYVIDLESSNGTELNGQRVQPSRYVELQDKDVLRFAGSERDYVLMLPPAEDK